MILLNDRTTTSECCSFQNGTGWLKIPPNGCRVSLLEVGSRLVSSSQLRRENNDRHAPPSIIAVGRDLAPIVAADNLNTQRLVLQTSTRAEFYSRRPGRIISSISLLCLAVALISLRSPLEATCKSVETPPVLLGGNSLLNNINHQSSPQSSTLADQIISQTATTAPTTTKATEETTSQEEKEEEGDNGSGAGRDDDAAEGCAGISADGSAETANLTDNERLVNLQSCFQGKIRRQLKGATRDGMEVFERLSLSGGCSSSLMALTNGLGQLKSYAFKFLDASAKIPSGMMSGLLSDYGDFDQCMSIRSNKEVALEDEAEEGAFSGKYCLLSLKLNYRVKLAENGSAPWGIIEDGIFWDELVRHYWTSKISKGFQVGMCFPSRCTNDDLNQLYQHFAKSFNVLGEIISCQDSLDLKRQYQPDLLQRAIIYIFYALFGLTFIGTLVDRCWPQSSNNESGGEHELLVSLTRVLLCFSIAKNWTRFLHGYQSRRWQRQQNISWTYPDAGLVGCENLKRADNDTTPSSAPTGRSSILLNRSSTISSSENVDFIDLDPESASSSFSGTDDSSRMTAPVDSSTKLGQPLTVRIDSLTCHQATRLRTDLLSSSSSRTFATDDNSSSPLAHLSGLKLLIIMWITVGYSFLYPSASNYQYYRSIMRMNLTRDSVWFATTNFTLGIDMLLYITGLLFVYELGRRSKKQLEPDSRIHASGILTLISRKALRFWPTYLTVIGFAIVAPLISDGPMWPEMVSKRLGDSCRQNWWANLLFINNYLNQSNICLPSSWFISILMQLFLVGSIIVVVARKVSLEAGLAILTTLLLGSSVCSFCFAHFLRIRAPVIKMDESFVMDLEEDIFRLYTNIFNNLGPFLVGMAGGLLLIRHQAHTKQQTSAPVTSRASKKTASKPHQVSTCLGWLCETLIALAVATIAVLVLSSVFHENYSPLNSAIYWSLHRIGWAIVTGYLIHNCATGKWRLINDLLSLSAFAPLSRLVFIGYLLYPIFIHIHTGLVRDGLHVSIYNMLNIYITRLVMTFVAALIIHLLVELPFSQIEEMYLRKWIYSSRPAASAEEEIEVDPSRLVALAPLLVVAPKCELILIGHHDKTQENNSSDKLTPAERTTEN